MLSVPPAYTLLLQRCNAEVPPSWNTRLEYIYALKLHLFLQNVDEIPLPQDPNASYQSCAMPWQSFYNKISKNKLRL